MTRISCRTDSTTNLQANRKYQRTTKTIRYQGRTLRRPLFVIARSPQKAVSAKGQLRRPAPGAAIVVSIRLVPIAEVIGVAPAAFASHQSPITTEKTVTLCWRNGLLPVTFVQRYPQRRRL